MTDTPPGVPYPWIRDELNEAKVERKELRGLVVGLASKLDTLANASALREASRARMARILIATIAAVGVFAAALAAN